MSAFSFTLGSGTSGRNGRTTTLRRRARRGGPRRRRLRLEALEPRWLLATLDVQDGILTYHDDAGHAAWVELGMLNGDYHVETNSATPITLGSGATAAGCVMIREWIAACPVGGITQARFYLEDGNDRVRVNRAPFPTVIEGSTGADEVDVLLPYLQAVVQFQSDSEDTLKVSTEGEGDNTTIIDRLPTWNVSVRIDEGPEVLARALSRLEVQNNHPYAPADYSIEHVDRALGSVHVQGGLVQDWYSVAWDNVGAPLVLGELSDPVDDFLEVRSPGEESRVFSIRRRYDEAEYYLDDQFSGRSGTPHKITAYGVKDLVVPGGRGADSFEVIATNLHADGTIMLGGAGGADHFLIYEWLAKSHVEVCDGDTPPNDEVRVQLGEASHATVRAEGLIVDDLDVRLLTPVAKLSVLGSDKNESLEVIDTTATRVWLEGGNGNDTFSIDQEKIRSGATVTVSDVEGRDSLTIYSTGDHSETIGVTSVGDRNAVTHADRGHVFYYASVENLTLQGTQHDDVFTIDDRGVGRTEVAVLGGAGNDRIDAGSLPAAPSFLPDISRTGVYLSGGDGNDQIRGSRGGDRIEGNEGDDILLGQEGPDLLIGGSGSDTIIPGKDGSLDAGDDGWLNSADVSVDVNTSSEYEVGDKVPVSFLVTNRGEDTAVFPTLYYQAAGAVALPMTVLNVGHLFVDPFSGQSTDIRVLDRGGIETYQVEARAVRAGEGRVSVSAGSGYADVIPDPNLANNRDAAQVRVKPRRTGGTPVTPYRTASGDPDPRPGSGARTTGTAVSGDGTKVGILSSEPALFPTAVTSNEYTQAYVADPVLVSVSADGTAGGNAPTTALALSGDGSTAVFASLATNLVAEFNDLNGANGADLFARDLQSGVTQLVSVNQAGTGSGNGASEQFFGGALQFFFVSADGRFVAFTSEASDLVADDANGRADVFLRDLQAGTTQLVTVGRDGTAADQGGMAAALSADGRYVLFTSESTNLLPADVPQEIHLYRRDLQTGVTELVDVRADGSGPASGFVFGGPGSGATIRLSPDGRYVVFASQAPDLVAGVTNDNDTSMDIFWRDLQAGVTRYVTWTTAGTPNLPNLRLVDPRLSADGRLVAFGGASQAGTEYVAGLLSQAGLYVRDMTLEATEVLNLRWDGAGIAENGMMPLARVDGISSDGRYVLLATNTTELLPGITPAVAEPLACYYFVRDRLRGSTTLINRSRQDGQTTDNGSSWWHSAALLSADGQVVHFTSAGDNLTRSRPDLPNTPDVFASSVHVALTYVVPNGNGADSLTLRRSGDDLQLLDDATGQPVATRPLADIQAVIIDGALDEADTLTIDFSGGTFALPGGIQFDGGTTGEDRIVVQGGTFTDVRYEALGPGAGTVVLDGLAVLFTTTDSVQDLAPATNREFAGFLDGDQTIVVQDDGDPGNGRSQVAPGTAGAFVPVTFAHPTAWLTVAGGDGNDTLTVQALEAGFAAQVRLAGGAGNDVLDATAFAGAAMLDGGPGDDTLRGGPGDTTYAETPGSTDTLTDPGGSDTLDFSGAFAPITMDLVAQDTNQVVDSAGNVVHFSGPIENFVGSAYADQITVAPLAVPQNIDGGPNASGVQDTLLVNTHDPAATNDGSVIQVPGFAPISATGGSKVSAGQPPEAVPDYYELGSNAFLIMDVAANDTDPEGDAFQVVAVTQPEHGTAELLADGQVQWTPAPGFEGLDWFTYTIADGLGGSSTAGVFVAVNGTPAAQDDTLSTPEDTTQFSFVLSNDSDPDGDPLTVLGVTCGPHGTAAVVDGLFVSYTPAADFHGQDTCTYTISDGNHAAVPATVTVDVTPVNDAPVLAEIGEKTAYEVRTLTFTASATDVDQPADTLTFSLDQASLDAGMTIDAVTGVFQWTPTAAEGPGHYDVTITVADQGTPALSDAETFVVSVVELIWRNPAHPCDVNGDGKITPQDVLTLINDLNSRPPRDLGTAVPPTPAPPPFLDPTGDGRITPEDVLFVISDLNVSGPRVVPGASGGEGESVLVVETYPGSRRSGEDAAEGLQLADAVPGKRAWSAVPGSTGQDVSSPPAERSAVVAAAMPERLPRRLPEGRLPSPLVVARSARWTRWPDGSAARASETPDLDEALTAIAGDVGRAWSASP